MSYFNYRNGELFCEDVKISDVISKVPTPFYLYSGSGLVENFERIDAAFGATDHTICYAMKANSNLTLLKKLAAKGCGADVVSGGELYLALKAGFDPEKIVFAGVGKTDEELTLAIETGIAAINVESPEELQTVQDLAAGLGKKANIALRVNPDVDVHGHPFISTGSAFNKFGIDWEEAAGLYARALKEMPNVNMMGIHCHIGSMIFNMDYYAATAQRLKKLVETLRNLGAPIKHIDIGGGLGVKYDQPMTMTIDGETRAEIVSPHPKELVETILPILEPLKCQIFFEPGRSIVANTGILVTRALFVKNTRGKRFISCDSGMHQLIRPALYGGFHFVAPVHENTGPYSDADVVGPICESSDFLAQDHPMPDVKRGDYLAVMTAGAYGFSMASTYNGHPLPPEIMVEKENFSQIRKAQTYEDLLTFMV